MTTHRRILELTEEERAAFLSDPKVLDFIDDSTKIFHRVLNDHYNYMSDYTQGTETGGYVGFTLNYKFRFIAQQRRL